VGATSVVWCRFQIGVVKVRMWSSNFCADFLRSGQLLAWIFCGRAWWTSDIEDGQRQPHSQLPRTQSNHIEEAIAFHIL
jgi:hypothetical protein